jgi:hypothetical protein
MKTRSLAATLVLVVLAAAPLALAQSGTKPKKRTKPAASASAEPAATPEPAPDPAPATAPADESTSAPDKAEKKELPVTPPEKSGGDSSDTREDPNKAYYFIGLRYRGTVIPKFMVNLFVNEGSTFYSNTVAGELDIRKDNHSTDVWFGYTGFGFGDTLFWQKDKPDDSSNWTVVSSSLWGLFVGIDELWSVPIDQSHHWDFEYGFGVGLGFIFGSLNNDWVYRQGEGAGPFPYTDSQGRKYAMCKTTGDAASCNPANHQNSNVSKVGGYQEPNWFSGGSIPVVFPQIYFPSVGVRFKPVKEFEGRVGLGFSLTGFWFGISGNYGLEKAQEAAAPSKSTGLAGDSGRGRGML